MKNEVKGKALVDFEIIINEVSGASYSEGEKQGRINGVQEYEQELEREFEKQNYEFAAAQFADCLTLSDFQYKLKEITNRSYNFMT